MQAQPFLTNNTQLHGFHKLFSPRSLSVTYTSSPEAQEVSASDSGVSACNFQSKTTESLHQGFITGGLVINGRFDVKRILQMYTSRLQAGGCPIGILNYIQDLWGEVFQ